MVRISGFHPDGPGSIPGVGTPYFFSRISHNALYVRYSGMVFEITTAGTVLAMKNPSGFQNPLGLKKSSTILQFLQIFTIIKVRRI